MCDEDTKEAMRSAILAQIDRWAFAPSAWESATVRAVSKLPTTLVQRLPTDQLFSIGMQPNECHDNAWFQQENDPEGESQFVVGWIDGGEGRYALHSVCEAQGILFCVTPTPHLAATPFKFIRDDQIQVSFDDESFSFTRDGGEIGVGIRMHPQKVIAECQVIKDRLQSGEDPYLVMR